jgi:hypothetical protein
MKIKFLSTVSGAMLLALAVFQQDAIAENLPGLAAHPTVTTEWGCFSFFRSAIKNNGTCGTGAHNVALPLMGKNDGDQQVTANVLAVHSTSDVSCYVGSADPSNIFVVYGPYNAPSSGTPTSIDIPIDPYSPGGTFLDCSLAPGAELINVVWTM